MFLRLCCAASVTTRLSISRACSTTRPAAPRAGILVALARDGLPGRALGGPGFIMISPVSKADCRIARRCRLK